MYTRSNVFFALSETKGSAIGGMRSDAGIVMDRVVSYRCAKILTWLAGR